MVSRVLTVVKTALQDKRQILSCYCSKKTSKTSPHSPEPTSLILRNIYSCFHSIVHIFSKYPSRVHPTQVLERERNELLLSRFSRVRLCATPQTAAHQAPPSMGFSRQEYWSGVPLPSLRNELATSYYQGVFSLSITN